MVDTTSTPLLRRTPSVRLMQNMCRALDGGTAPSKQSIDSYLQCKDDEDEVLERGQRLCTLTSELAPEAFKPQIRATIHDALERGSQRFTAARKVTDSSFKSLIDASTNRTLAPAALMGVSAGFDREAVRREVEAAAEAFKLPATLATARAFPLSCLETLAQGLLTRLQTNIPKIFARMPDWIQTSRIAAEGGHLPPHRETDSNRRAIAFFRTSAGEESWAAFEALFAPDPGDDTETTLFKQNLGARVRGAIGALVNDRDIARIEAFYDSTEGKSYLDRQQEIQAPYVADLTAAIDAVCHNYTRAIEAAWERHKQQELDHEQQVQEEHDRALETVQRSLREWIDFVARRVLTIREYLQT